jgi:phenylalanyl-tRNA synthetase beta chain
LIPNLLKNVQKNQKFFKEIRIFELGKIFKDLKEKRMLTGLMMGDRFFEAKGVVDLLLNKMGIANIYYDQYEPTPEDSEISIWQKGKSAEIKVNGEEIGFLGEISKRILENLKIPRLVIFDIDFEKLSQLATEEQEYQIISPYPAAIRDIAVLVPKEVRVDEVLNIIYDSGGKLIRDVDLFDIYEGEGIPLEKKSLAFHIIYQSDVKTLSSKEIDEIQKKVIEALEKNPNWEVRK